VPSYAKRHKLSTEEAARRVRYNFLAEVAFSEGSDYVAVAHTADDQAETVLMHLLRGSGTHGLAGMKPLQQMVTEPLEHDDQLAPTHSHALTIFRPMLAIWRGEIEEYCRQEGLQPRQDATNRQLDYRRNRIRHELIPLLQSQYAPAIKQHLLNLSNITGEEDRLLEELAEQAAQHILHFDAEMRVATLHPGKAGALPKAISRRLARHAIKAVAGTLDGFTFHHIESLSRLIMGEAVVPASLHLPHGLVVSAQREQVYVAPGDVLPTLILREVTAWPTMDTSAEHLLQPDTQIMLVEGWSLHSSIESAAAVNNKAGDLLALFDMDAIEQLGPLVVRTRRPGDFVQPIGMAGRKSLQDLFVDAKIPREQRERMPVVALGRSAGEILWVPGKGGRRSSHAPVAADTSRVLVLEMREEDEIGGSVDDARA
jgi:tRNA(Ile)-lysidine synthase